MNDYLQQIDAATGRTVFSFGKDGVIDLREGLGRDPATVGRIQSGNPGKVFENLVLLGGSTGEAYMSPPGDLRAFDVITGKLVWQFHTVPRPGEFGYDTWPKDAYKYVGGTNTWGEISIDEKRGIAYFPTGSPTYDYYGADRRARTCSVPRSSRWTRGQESVSGTSRWSITISGTSTTAPHRS